MNRRYFTKLLLSSAVVVPRLKLPAEEPKLGSLYGDGRTGYDVPCYMGAPMVGAYYRIKFDYYKGLWIFTDYTIEQVDEEYSPEWTVGWYNFRHPIRYSMRQDLEKRGVLQKGEYWYPHSIGCTAKDWMTLVESKLVQPPGYVPQEIPPYTRRLSYGKLASK